MAESARKRWEKELNLFASGKSGYVWDELEELLTDAFAEEVLSNEEYDQLMERLMDLDCG